MLLENTNCIECASLKILPVPQILPDQLHILTQSCQMWGAKSWYSDFWSSVPKIFGEFFNARFAKQISKNLPQISKNLPQIFETENRNLNFWLLPSDSVKSWIWSDINYGTSSILIDVLRIKLDKEKKNNHIGRIL